MCHANPQSGKTCPKGHRIADRDARFCPQCGGKLTEPEAPSPAPSPQPPQHDQAPPLAPVDRPPADAVQPVIPPLFTQPPPQTQPHTCPCGQLLPDEAKFCFQCGKEVARSHARFSLISEVDGKPVGRADLDRPELVIGKTDDCALQIPHDNYISRKHARLFLSDDKVLLEDLGSANGTYLRVRKPIPLEPGDEVFMGTTKLRLQENGA